MKEVKIIIIATVITCLIIVSTAFALPAQAEEAAPSELYYGKLVVVTAVTRLDTALWVVECQDKDGQRWAFLDDERLAEGDILTLLMYRLNEREEDDECMEYMYEGHTDNINMFFQVMGWR